MRWHPPPYPGDRGAAWICGGRAGCYQLYAPSGSYEPGILVTAYASLKKDVSWPQIRSAYEKYYGNEKFIRLLDENVCPQTRWVEGSNYVDINFKVDPRTHRVIIMGAIDNLVKGAAGQAVQNMNLMFGLAEDEGLDLVPLFP